MAELEVEFEVGRLLMYRAASVMDEGRPPTVEASVSKVHGTGFEQKLANLVMTLLGPYGPLKGWATLAAMRGLPAHSYLASKGYSLQAGSTEVLKSIIAGRALGLPTQ